MDRGEEEEEDGKEEDGKGEDFTLIWIKKIFNALIWIHLLLLRLYDSLPATTTMLPSCTVCLLWHLHCLFQFFSIVIKKIFNALIWIHLDQKIFYVDVDGKESRHA